MRYKTFSLIFGFLFGGQAVFGETFQCTKKIAVFDTNNPSQQFVREQPALPQSWGGHMRLIIGYNSKKSEIIYTDSWGAGHEFKRMSVDDAFFITKGLYSVLPSS